MKKKNRESVSKSFPKSSMRKKEELFRASVLLKQQPARLRPVSWLENPLPWRDNIWDGIRLRRASIWQPSIPDLAWLYAAYALMGLEPPTHHRLLSSHRAQTPQRSGRGWGRPAMFSAGVEQKYLSSVQRGETQERGMRLPAPPTRHRKAIVAPGKEETIFVRKQEGKREEAVQQLRPMSLLAKAKRSEIQPKLTSSRGEEKRSAPSLSQLRSLYNKESSQKKDQKSLSLESESFIAREENLAAEYTGERKSEKKGGILSSGLSQGVPSISWSEKGERSRGGMRYAPLSPEWSYIKGVSPSVEAVEGMQQRKVSSRLSRREQPKKVSLKRTKNETLVVDSSPKGSSPPLVEEKKSSFSLREDRTEGRIKKKKRGEEEVEAPTVSRSRLSPPVSIEGGNRHAMPWRRPVIGEERKRTGSFTTPSVASNLSKSLVDQISSPTSDVPKGGIGTRSPSVLDASKRGLGREASLLSAPRSLESGADTGSSVGQGERNLVQPSLGSELVLPPSTSSSPEDSTPTRVGKYGRREGVSSERAVAKKKALRTLSRGSARIEAGRLMRPQKKTKAEETRFTQLKAKKPKSTSRAGESVAPSVSLRSRLSRSSAVVERGTEKKRDAERVQRKKRVSEDVEQREFDVVQQKSKQKEVVQEREKKKKGKQRTAAERETPIVRTEREERERIEERKQVREDLNPTERPRPPIERTLESIPPIRRLLRTPPVWSKAIRITKGREEVSVDGRTRSFTETGDNKRRIASSILGRSVVSPSWSKLSSVYGQSLVRVSTETGRMVSIPMSSLPSYLSSKTPEEAERITKEVSRFVRERSETTRKKRKVNDQEDSVRIVRRLSRQGIQSSSNRSSWLRKEQLDVVRVSTETGRMVSIPMSSLPSYLSSKTPEEAERITKQITQFRKTSSKKKKSKPRETPKSVVSSVRRFLRQTGVLPEIQKRVVEIVQQDAEQSIEGILAHVQQGLIPPKVGQAIVVQIQRVVRLQQRRTRGTVSKRARNALRPLASVMRRAKMVQAQEVERQIDLVATTEVEEVSRIGRSIQRTWSSGAGRSLVSRGSKPHSQLPSRKIRYVSEKTETVYPVARGAAESLEEKRAKKKGKERSASKKVQSKGKYGPKKSGKGKVWSATDDIFDQIKEEEAPAPKIVKQKQTMQKAKKKGKKRSRDVNKKMSEELLLEILHELTEDTPEARQLLRDISIKVDFLKKLDDLRKL
jgi:hypothetical protein